MKGTAMKILILEDEPIIAIDLEEIVLSNVRADVVIAATIGEAYRCLSLGIDFALLDIRLGEGRRTSLPVAERLRDAHIPFAFISGSLELLPEDFRDVPKLAKPFTPHDVARVLPVAA